MRAILPGVVTPGDASITTTGRWRGTWGAAPADVARHLPSDDARTVVVHSLLSSAPREFHTRAFVARDESGAYGAVLAIGRICPDRWVAAPWLFDESVAPVVAEVINRSRACFVNGPAQMLSPLVPHIRRGRMYKDLPFFSASNRVIEPFAHRHSSKLAAAAGPGGLLLPEPDPRVRLGRKEDIREIMSLIGKAGYDYMPTQAKARRHIGASLAQGRVLVAEAEDAVQGAIWSEYRSPRWEMWTGLRVSRTGKRHGLSWALAWEAMRQSEASGRTFCTTFAPTNLMVGQRYIYGHPECHEWQLLVLTNPPLFKGHSRLRRLVVRLEGPRPNGLS